MISHRDECTTTIQCTRCKEADTITMPTYDLCRVGLLRRGWFCMGDEVCIKCILQSAKATGRSVEEEIQQVEKMIGAIALEEKKNL